MTDTPTADEVAEHRYLAKTLELVESAHANVVDSIGRAATAIDEQKRHMQKLSLDHRDY